MCFYGQFLLNFHISIPGPAPKPRQSACNLEETVFRAVPSYLTARPAWLTIHPLLCTACPAWMILHFLQREGPFLHEKGENAVFGLLPDAAKTGHQARRWKLAGFERCSLAAADLIWKNFALSPFLSKRRPFCAKTVSGPGMPEAWQGRSGKWGRGAGGQMGTVRFCQLYDTLVRLSLLCYLAAAAIRAAERRRQSCAEKHTVLFSTLPAGCIA